MAEDNRNFPQGFESYVANAGIKDDTDDFSIVVSTVPSISVGVFTQSRFAGPSVLISKERSSKGLLRGVVTTSKNANVATGAKGTEDALKITEIAGAISRINPEDLAIASTGVIGRNLPMDRIEGLLNAGRPSSNIRKSNPADFHSVAKAMMTTDTVEKIATSTGRNLDGAEFSVTGIAKGVGMIEPNMATMLAYFFTDAAIEHQYLSEIFKRVIARTLNCVSIDGDTSTSDTSLVFANGLAGQVEPGALEQELEAVALALTKAIARDGEGATKLLEVTVDCARDYDQAKKVAKLIVNSPLVKAAVNGADPNWGRVAMAIGKAEDEKDITPETTTIRFGNIETYPAVIDDADLARLSSMMQDDHVLIHVSLGTGNSGATVWGCDLSDGYVRINADYTT